MVSPVVGQFPQTSSKNLSRSRRKIRRNAFAFTCYSHAVLRWCLDEVRIDEVVARSKQTKWLFVRSSSGSSVTVSRKRVVLRLSQVLRPSCLQALRQEINIDQPTPFAKGRYHSLANFAEHSRRATCGTLRYLAVN